MGRGEEGKTSGERGRQREEGAMGTRVRPMLQPLQPRHGCCFVFTWPSTSLCGPQTDVNDVSHSSFCTESSALLMSCGETFCEDGRHRRSNKSCDKTASAEHAGVRKTGRNNAVKTVEGVFLINSCMNLCFFNISIKIINFI